LKGHHTSGPLLHIALILFINPEKKAQIRLVVFEKNAKAYTLIPNPWFAKA